MSLSFLFHGELSHSGNFTSLFLFGMRMWVGLLVTLWDSFFLFFSFVWSHFIIFVACAAKDHRKGYGDEEDTVSKRWGRYETKVIFLSLFKLFLDFSFKTLFWCNKFLELFIIFLRINLIIYFNQVNQESVKFTQIIKWTLILFFILFRHVFNIFNCLLFNFSFTMTFVNNLWLTHRILSCCIERLHVDGFIMMIISNSQFTNLNKNVINSLFTD